MGRRFEETFCELSGVEPTDTPVVQGSAFGVLPGLQNSINDRAQSASFLHTLGVQIGL